MVPIWMASNTMCAIVHYGLRSRSNMLHFHILCNVLQLFVLHVTNTMTFANCCEAVWLPDGNVKGYTYKMNNSGMLVISNLIWTIAVPYSYALVVWSKILSENEALLDSLWIARTGYPFSVLRVAYVHSSCCNSCVEAEELFNEAIDGKITLKVAEAWPYYLLPPLHFQPI